MYKKFLCVILSVAMILSMVTLPGFAAGAADLSAGCVVYSDVDGNQIRSLTGGAAVKASTALSNAGSAAADAVVWVATYENGVLAGTAYSAVSVPAGGTADVSVTTQAMPADVSNVVLYTYIWDSFTNMNSIAPVATFPSSNTDLSVATVGGEALQFSLADGAAILRTDAEAAAGDLTVKAVAADNSAKVEVIGALSFTDNVTIKVTAADGTVRDYTVSLKKKLVATGELAKVYTVPTRESLNTQLLIESSAARKAAGIVKEIKPGEPVKQDDLTYSDRDWFKFLTTGSKLLGTTPMILALNEVRGENQKAFAASGDEYFYFTANESGTIYVTYTEAMKSYEDPANGWTKVTSPKQDVPGFTGQEWYDNAKAPDSYTYDPDAYPYYTNNIQYDKDHTTCYLGCYTTTYYKTFEAGEKVTLYTNGTGNNQNFIPMIAWDEEAAAMPSVDITLKSLTYNGISVPNFDPEKTNYSITLYDGLPDSIEVVGVPNNDNPDDGVSATTELTESTANTAVYTVTVTDKDGNTKKYTVTFRALEEKKIYDLKTASDLGVLTENGGYNVHTDTWVGAGSDMNKAPIGIEDDIQDGTTLVYSDRNNVKLNSKGTLNGATIIRRSKGESAPKRFDPGEPPTIHEGSIFKPYYSPDFVSPLGGKTWVSFVVSSDAVIYMSDPIGAGWPNNPVGEDGQKEWKLTTESTDDKIKTTYLNVATVWYKEVKAGDIVEIPSYGAPATWDDKSICWDPSIFVVQWKESAVPTPTPTPPAESTNANLATLKYDDTAIALESGKTEYDVVLGEAKTVNLTWTFADDGATSEPQSGVSLAVSEAGASQTIVVTAEDKTTTKEYKVNFTVKKVNPNEIYDLNYHNSDKYALQTIKRSTPASVNDGTATPTWMYSGYVGLDKGEMKDGKYQWNTSDGYSQTWAILKTDGTSEYFEDAALIAMDKGEAGNPTANMKFFNGPEYDGKNGTYWLTFRVSSPGIIYFIDRPGAGWFNKPEDWNTVPSSSGLSFNGAGNMFYKHVEANELVQVPNYGDSETWKPGTDRKATEPGAYVIAWDELQPYKIAISGDNDVTVGKPVTLSAAMTKAADDSAVADATFKWVITDGTDKAAIDNATGVLTPSAAGTITVAASDAAGRAIGYKDITIGELVSVDPVITNLTPNPDRPIKGAIKYNGENIGKADINNLYYTDRKNLTFGHVSQTLKGCDTIILSRGDMFVKNDAAQKEAQSAFMKGNNEYFNFTGNHEGTVYVLSASALPNYTAENGWATLNNGTGLTFPYELDENSYDGLKTLPFAYNPTEPAYYATRVQWFYEFDTPAEWDQNATWEKEVKQEDGSVTYVTTSTVEQADALKYVYGKTFDANTPVSVLTPGLETSAGYPHHFTVLVKWEKDALATVPEISDGGIEDTGEVAAKTASSVELAADAAVFTITAQQNPTNTEITVNGTSASAAGTLVPVVVYKPGMTPAMADAAVKNGTSLDTIIAGVKQVVVKNNNTYTADFVFVDDAESGAIEIWASDGASKDKVVLDFVNPGVRLAAMEAIIDAANAPENVAELLSAAISSNLAELDGDAGLFNGLTEEGKKHVAATVANEIKTIDKTDINNYKKVADPIDAASLLVALSEGKISDKDAERVLPNLSGTGLAATAVADYKAGRISDAGKAILWNAMKKDTGYYASWAEAQAPFIEQVFVNTVSNPGKNGVNDVAAAIKAYRSLSELSGCDWISYDSIAAAGKGNQFASKMMVKKPTSYEDFVTKFNEVVDELKVTPSKPGPGPSGGSGSGSGSGTGTTTTIDKTPSKKNIDSFKDANDAAWAKSALQVMLDKNIYEGYEDNTIRPNNNATREEVIKILVSTFFTVNKNARSSFSDVASNEWFYPYVATGEAKGITKGMGDGTFGVGLNVTRQDFAVMIYNYMLDKGIQVNTTPYNFVDDDAIADYARDAIYALKNAEIIKGYEDNTVVPEGSATRAEIAQMVANLIVLLGL